MARENNFLLGRGEVLTQTLTIKKGGGAKKPPYDFGTARERAQNFLGTVSQEIDSLPKEACPGDEAVAIVTLHPRYLSKSDYPEALLREAGLRPVGSKIRRLSPDIWSPKKATKEATAEDIFVAGPRQNIRQWSQSINKLTPGSDAANQLGTLEEISPYYAHDKLKFGELGFEVSKDIVLEVVLHNNQRSSLSQSKGSTVLDAFIDYAKMVGATPVASRVRNIQGLTFLPVRAHSEILEELALFSFLRAARAMPSVRPSPYTILRENTEPVALPSSQAIDPGSRAVIFDGGLPKEMVEVLSPWVRYIEPDGIGKSVPGLEEHGLGVTSAFLFGHLATVSAPQPFCKVDHVRVLDEAIGKNGDYMYLDVLERIESFLDENEGLYKFANLSLGPSLPAEDDDITLWTAALDSRLAGGKLLMTAAVGNEGERDPVLGLNRVQPPSDGVNLLAVGSTNRTESPKARAKYSCVGPGRNPGLVKPDGLAFGGSSDVPFTVLNPKASKRDTRGTSYAAPLALRACASVSAQLGENLSPLAIRALTIHRAEARELCRFEAGWGIFETDPVRLITCEDNEALVVYQGELPIGEYLRFWAPYPPEGLTGDVFLSGTLLIAPEVDPGHAGNYTRAGLDVSFRPHCEKYGNNNGRLSKHPKTRTFFSRKNLYNNPEYKLRDDAHKWEPCRKHTLKIQGESLMRPSFDVLYNHRDGLEAHDNPPPLNYAFVVGIRAPESADLYNQIVRTYQNILVPLKPRIRLTVSQAV